MWGWKSAFPTDQFFRLPTRIITIWGDGITWKINNTDFFFFWKKSEYIHNWQCSTCKFLICSWLKDNISLISLIAKQLRWELLCDNVGQHDMSMAEWLPLASHWFIITNNFKNVTSFLRIKTKCLLLISLALLKFWKGSGNFWSIRF